MTRSRVVLMYFSMSKNTIWTKDAAYWRIFRKMGMGSPKDNIDLVHFFLMSVFLWIFQIILIFCLYTFSQFLKFTDYLFFHVYGSNNGNVFNKMLVISYGLKTIYIIYCPNKEKNAFFYFNLFKIITLPIGPFSQKTCLQTCPTLRILKEVESESASLCLIPRITFKANLTKRLLRCHVYFCWYECVPTNHWHS